MKLLETKHIFSRVNIIKKDLFKAVAIVSCISMLAFMAYYVYLISQNLQNGLYITFYSILISTIILFFVVEICLRENKKSSKNKNRLTLEKKRTLRFVIKLLKYFAKTALIVVAIYETVTNFNISISNVVNICSGIFLVIQILFDFIAHYIIKQLDYLKLSFDLDFKESSFLFKKFFPIKDLEDKLMKYEEGNGYTQKEQEIIDEIKLEAAKYEKELQVKKEDLEQQYKDKKKESKPTIKGKVRNFIGNKINKVKKIVSKVKKTNKNTQ